MCRTSLALALLLVAAGPSPIQAQEWWGRPPCFGPCRPWAVVGPEGPPPVARWRFGLAQGFAPGSWWSPRAIRWRRFVAMREAEEAQRFAAPAPARFGGWVWRRRAAPSPAPSSTEAAAPPAPRAAPAPVRGGEALAAVPVEALPPRRPRALVPSRVLAAAALLRPRVAPPRSILHAATLPPEPPPRPGEAREAASPPVRPALAAAARRRIHPVALRSQPALISPGPSETDRAPAPAQASPAIPAPAPAQAAAPAADVPAAPLD